MSVDHRQEGKCQGRPHVIGQKAPEAANKFCNHSWFCFSRPSPNSTVNFRYSYKTTRVDQEMKSIVKRVCGRTKSNIIVECRAARVHYLWTGHAPGQCIQIKRNRGLELESLSSAQAVVAYSWRRSAEAEPGMVAKFVCCLRSLLSNYMRTALTFTFLSMVD